VGTTYLCDCFGTIIDEPKHAEQLRHICRHLEHLPDPKEGESFSNWSAFASPLPTAMARMIYDLTWTEYGEPEVLFYDDVIHIEHERAIRVPFVAVAYVCCNLVRWNITRKRAAQLIRRFTRAAGVSAPEPTLLDVSCWRGEGTRVPMWPPSA
jgi:hypothetical protein